MRKFTLLLLVTSLMVQYANAQADRRYLRWRDQNAATNVYNIKNSNNSNTFLNPNNWRVVDNNTGTVTAEVATPGSGDVLQIYDASLTLDVDFDMSALENIILDFGNPKPGTTYSLLLKENAAWILHQTAKIYVRGGQLSAVADNVGIVDTWIQIGSVIKLLAFSDQVAVVYAPATSNSIYQSATPAQEGFTAGLLPVIFSSFDAFRESSGVNISWKTRQESESKLFYVERSSDGRNYTPIATLPAAGTSSTVRSYSINDATAVNGVVYYRVRIVSTDNLSGYTPVKAVRSTAAARKLSLYPNPATSTVQLIIPNPQSEAFMVALYNESGQLVMNRSVGSDGNMLTLDVSRLAPGNYSAEARFAGGTRYQSRFMIKR